MSHYLLLRGSCAPIQAPATLHRNTGPSLVSLQPTSTLQQPEQAFTTAGGILLLLGLNPSSPGG